MTDPVTDDRPTPAYATAALIETCTVCGWPHPPKGLMASGHLYGYRKSELVPHLIADHPELPPVAIRDMTNGGAEGMHMVLHVEREQTHTHPRTESGALALDHDHEDGRHVDAYDGSHDDVAVASHTADDVPPPPPAVSPVEQLPDDYDLVAMRTDVRALLDWTRSTGRSPAVQRVMERLAIVSDGRNPGMTAILPLVRAGVEDLLVCAACRAPGSSGVDGRADSRDPLGSDSGMHRSCAERLGVTW